jgi:hypothetical protein
MTEEWLAFFGGILSVLVGGLIASVVQRHNDAVRRKDEARLAVYFQLLDLDQNYFSIASCELRGEEPSHEVVVRCREISWKLADDLRKNDGVEYLTEILEILFSNSITSANERANRLGEVIDKYGLLVNPAYSNVIKRISAENVKVFAGGRKIKNSAPTLW